MKRIYSIGITLILLLVPKISQGQLCSSPIDLRPLGKAVQIAAIQGAFDDPCAIEVSGNCEICFLTNQIEIQNIDGIDGFSMSVDPVVSQDIYVVGLNLVKDDSVVSDNAFLDITHNGTGTVYLEDTQLSNVKNGLKLAGSGAIQLASYLDGPVTVAGNAGKEGACIDVQVNSAVLEGVQASGCGDGVKVDADEVSITNGSVIKGHKIGVHVLSGRMDTLIEQSLVYWNDDGDPSNLLREDGVKFEDVVMHEAVFYDIEGEDPVPVLDDDEVYDYGDRTAYVLMDIPDGKEGQIEFFLSEDAACELGGDEHAYGQPCKLVTGMTNPITLKSSVMAYGPVRVTLPSESHDKAVVVVYNDPDRGTAGISRQFATDGGVVAFVSSPYDIPTTSGLAGDDAAPSTPEEEDDGGGSGMGGDGVGTEGGGGVIEAAGGVAGGCGGGGASLAGDSFRTVALLMDLWWNLLLVGVILGVRKAYARVHREPRRPRHR